MSNLKAGAKVKLRVVFDAGGVEYKNDYEGEKIMAIAIATHENQASAIEGIPTGVKGISLSPLGPQNYTTTLADFGFTQFLQDMTSQYTLNDFGKTYPTYEAELIDVTPSTRLCFYPMTYIQIDGIGNNECAIYVDNIRVSIISE
jgi:hypothetical protein